MDGLILRVSDGRSTGSVIPVNGELRIGRDAQPPGELGGDSGLSRQHALIRRASNGVWTIEDLGSTNGTHVNGTRVSGPHPLRVDDQIVVGQTRLTVSSVGPANAPTAPATPAAPPVGATIVANHPYGAPASPYGAPASPYGGSPIQQVGGPVPGYGGGAVAAPPKRGKGGLIALAVVVAGAAIGGGLYAARSKGSGSGGGGGGGGAFDGTVFVESNKSGDNQNSILALRYRYGTLQPVRIAEYPTGGKGSADLADTGVLDADQQLILDRKRKLLLAVNQGSDTIAVFRYDKNGLLKAVKGSPFPSGGKAPASIGIVGDTVIVVNKAQDGIRDLKKEKPNYTSFKIADNGTLTPAGSTVEITPGSSPTQALISNEGTVLVSTEEAGPFRAFTIDKSGRLTEGPNSPLRPDASLFPPGFPEDKKWALGLGAHPTKPIVYAEMATVSKLAVYTYEPDSKLKFEGAVDNTDSVLPCWSLLNKGATRLYTSNAGSNNVTVFDIGTDPMKPKQLQSFKLKSNGNPWNIALSEDEKLLFVLNPRANAELVKPGEGNTLHILSVDGDGKLSEAEGSAAALPVPLDTNPIGIAVLAN